VTVVRQLRVLTPFRAWSSTSLPSPGSSSTFRRARAQIRPVAVKAPAAAPTDDPEATTGPADRAASASTSGTSRLRSLGRKYAADRTGSWRVLQQPAFRAYFIGCTISNLGTWLQNTAQLILAYRLTHSVFAVAIITSAQFSGFLTIGPWAGSLGARLGRRNVLIGAQLLSFVITGILACVEFTGRLTELDLFFGALGTGLALTFALPIQTAMVSGLVHEKDRKAALALNSVSYNAGRTLAPLLYLAVLASIGTAWAFALNSISFLAFALIVIGLYPRAAIGQQARVRHRDVFGFALQRPRIALLLLMVAAVTFADDPVLVLGPSLAQKLGVPSFWPAYFLAALGIGTVVGAMFPTRPAKTRRAAVPLAVLAIAVVVFALGVDRWVSLAAAVVAGIAGLLTGAASQALLLKMATPQHAVQVMALWGVAWAGTKPIASLADGLIASHLGIHAAALILALPALLIAAPEILLRKPVKIRLKRFMAKLNGTGKQTPQGSTA
jgi:MFS family permease